MESAFFGALTLVGALFVFTEKYLILKEKKMFDKNFNAEASIKKWATGIKIAGKVLLGLCLFAAFVLLVSSKYLQTVALIVAASGALTFLITSFSATMIWGFGELIGDTKRLSVNINNEQTKAEEIDELPEL